MMNDCDNNRRNKPNASPAEIIEYYAQFLLETKGRVKYKQFLRKVKKQKNPDDLSFFEIKDVRGFRNHLLDKHRVSLDIEEDTGRVFFEIIDDDKELALMKKVRDLALKDEDKEIDEADITRLALEYDQIREDRQFEKESLERMAAYKKESAEFHKTDLNKELEEWAEQVTEKLNVKAYKNIPMSEIKKIWDDYVDKRKLDPRLGTKNRLEFANKMAEILLKEDFINFALLNHSVAVIYNPEHDRTSFLKIDNEEEFDILVKALGISSDKGDN